MKILWANPNMLHPTTKGGQIRTLEMLRILSKRHEIHYVAFESDHPEARERSGEYCSELLTVPFRVVPRKSARFALQLARGLFSAMPVSIMRHYSKEMRQLVERLLRTGYYDRAVCDFLVSAPYFPDLARCLFFQHNVETMIWRRHAEQEPNPITRRYFRLQAERMAEFEQEACRGSGKIVAVSPSDAELMETMFGVTGVEAVPTGVSVGYFSPPSGTCDPVADIAFVGSMDYLPNIHGVRFFVEEVLPLIRRARPDTSFAVIGRRPPPDIEAYASRDLHIVVTGTVPDIRPFLWGSKISVVPLFVGGGTRLKIYESMAAKVPVVSTRVGAEGLNIDPPDAIEIADTASAMAASCVRLLDDARDRERVRDLAWEMVSARFSWERVTSQFERILESAPSAS